MRTRSLAILFSAAIIAACGSDRGAGSDPDASVGRDAQRQDTDASDVAPDEGTDTGADTGADADVDDVPDADVAPDSDVPDVGSDCVEDSDCDDGDFCNGVERCSLGLCYESPVVACPDDSVCATTSCDEEADECVVEPLEDLCGVDQICDPKTGCFTPNECVLDADCTDGLLCNGEEACVDGFCEPGPVAACDDAIQCTADTCDEETGGCQNVPDHARCLPTEICSLSEDCIERPPCEGDADCTDGFFCNGTEFCDTDGFCSAGSAVAVTDVVQGILMIFGLVVLPTVGLWHVGGVGALVETLRGVDPELLSVAHGIGPLVAGVAIGLGSFGSPPILVRTMSIDRTEALPRAARVATAWNVVMASGAVLIGLVGRAIFTSTDAFPGGDREHLFPMLGVQLSEQYLFAGFVGVLLAALFAAIMSTCDSQLLVIASSFVRDFRKKEVERGRRDEPPRGPRRARGRGGDQLRRGAQREGLRPVQLGRARRGVRARRPVPPVRAPHRPAGGARGNGRRRRDGRPLGEDPGPDSPGAPADPRLHGRGPRPVAAPRAPPA